MKQKKQNGFTIVEIMVVLVLISLGTAFVAVNVIGQLGEGKVKAATIQINLFKQQLTNYRRVCHLYPTTSEGLEVLLEAPSSGCPNYPKGGFIERKNIPPDPWDTPYFYESDGKTFEIISLGADKAEGGEDNDKDINSADL